MFQMNSLLSCRIWGTLYWKLSQFFDKQFSANLNTGLVLRGYNVPNIEIKFFVFVFTRYPKLMHKF